MSSPLFVSAVLLAAGQSTRMGDGTKKPFLCLEGETVLGLALQAFAAAPSIREVVLMVPHDHLEQARTLVGELEPSLGRGPGWVVAVLPGGAQRTDSVRLGVASTTSEANVILVHDVARPFVRPERIEQVAHTAADRGAAMLAVRASDTIKTSRDGEQVSGTLDRSLLWAAQTPQGFDAERLRIVLAKAHGDGFTPTDDAALFERYEGAVVLVEGDRDNIKLTSAEDLVLGAAILQARRQERESEAPPA